MEFTKHEIRVLWAVGIAFAVLIDVLAVIL